MLQKVVRTSLALVLILCLTVGSAQAFETEMVTGVDFGTYGQQAYAYLQQIDKDYFYRICTEEEQSAAMQDWLINELLSIGFSDDQLDVSDFIFTANYGQDYLSQNISATLPGQSDRQLIIGAHYDGTGAGDNGSGVSLLLETARDLLDWDTLPYTVVFVFFGAEEKGMHGSKAYTENMTDDEVANTMIFLNVDSIICGDFCYLYGGVPDMQTKTVSQLDAFEQVYAISQRLNLNIRLTPWTFENPAPGFDTPAYPSPVAGNWSDHASFMRRGIPYVYFEATNWDIPGAGGHYDGRTETADAGGFLHTARDTLSVVEPLFPGRVLYHMQVYSLLLHTVLAELE